MGTSLLNRFCAIMCAAVLAVSLGVGAAWADDLVAADEAQLDPTPTTEDVWLLTKVGANKMTYSKYGLLTKQKSSKRTVSYTYKAGRIVSYKSNKAANSALDYAVTGTVKYDAKGRMVKIIDGKKGWKNRQVRTYSYNKAGRVKSEKRTGFSPLKVTYSYNKAGRVKSIEAANKYNTQTYDYTYDAQGNLASEGHGVKGYNILMKSVYKNTYNSNGLIAKRVVPQSGANKTTKYTYKKVAIPLKYAETAKAQQWALVNGAKSFELPIVY